MAITYKPCAGLDIPAHVCDPCDIGEKGGIRSIALIKNTFVFTDPTDPTEWTKGITDKNIIVIPATRGTFDGGTPVTATGYGDLKEVVTGYDCTLSVRDPNYKQNAQFWTRIAVSKEFRIAFRTETLIHLSENVVSISPKNAVEEDINSRIDWQVDFKWSASKLPEPFDGSKLKDAIFVCKEVTTP